MHLGLNQHLEGKHYLHSLCRRVLVSGTSLLLHSADVFSVICSCMHSLDLSIVWLVLLTLILIVVKISKGISETVALLRSLVTHRTQNHSCCTGSEEKMQQSHTSKTVLIAPIGVAINCLQCLKKSNSLETPASLKSYPDHTDRRLH